MINAALTPKHGAMLYSSPRHIRRKRRMTAVVGVKCDGGVVLCADAQETSGAMKLPIQKLVPYQTEWYRAGIGGSGFDGDIIDMLVERLLGKLDKGNAYDTPSKMRLAMESVLVDAYGKLIKTAWPEQSIETEVDLLIALHAQNSGDVVLLKSHRTCVRILSTFDIIGAGDVMKYVALNLFRPNMPISQGVLLSIHLVGLAKKYVEGCGGPIQTLIITPERGPEVENAEGVERKERFFDSLNEILGEIILTAPDTWLSNEKFLGILNDAFGRIKDLRERYWAEAYESDLIRAMTDHVSYQAQAYWKFPAGSEGRLTQRVIDMMWEANERHMQAARKRQDEAEKETGGES